MTFVPQPFEQFVDDLLTSLTGGVAREAHPFIGREESYSLALPDPIPASIRASGQSGETFVLFESGIDYDFVADGVALRWRPNAKRVPDARSVFYVNYYRDGAQPRLTDRNPGSVTATLAEAFAREMAVLHQQMRRIYESGFIDLATGTALDQLTALLALSRKDARFASGEVLFKRATPAPGDISIPAGTAVSTANGQTFETTDKRTLRRGQLSIVAPIRAQVEGLPGRVEPATITSINRPIFGIDSVTNEAATFFATERESDDEFRRRAKGAIERAGKSTVAAIRLALIESVPGVSETNIQIEEHPTEPGLVAVRLGLEAFDAATVQRVEDAIFESRPAGVRVTHNLSLSEGATTNAPASADATSNGRNGSTPATGMGGGAIEAVTLEPEILARAPSGLLPLRAAVLLRLVQPALGVTQKETIEDAARTRLVEFIEGLPMGADLAYSKLIARVVADDEIADATVHIGPLDPISEPLLATNLATSGRKAKISVNDVAVELMEELVHIDVRVTVEPAPRTAASASVARISDGHRQAAREAATRVMAAARGALTRAQLREEIAAALASVQPIVQLVQDGAVVMNAEYEETGHLLNNTESISLEEHQIPVMRGVEVIMPGALGG